MPDGDLERKPGESLIDYAVRLFGASGTQRIKVHSAFRDRQNVVEAIPVVSTALASDGTVHPLVSSEGGALLPLQDHVFTSIAATVATEAQLQPADPKIFYLRAIWVVQGATAAGRNWQAKITDGTDELPMGPVVNVASGATAPLWPIKSADDVFMSFPPFPVSNAYYLIIEDAMAVAETATVWVTYTFEASELGTQP
jgi:hypothetical protein